jgi:hypothetical protein
MSELNQVTSTSIYEASLVRGAQLEARARQLEAAIRQALAHMSRYDAALAYSRNILSTALKTQPDGSPGSGSSNVVDDLTPETTEEKG